MKKTLFLLGVVLIALVVGIYADNPVEVPTWFKLAGMLNQGAFRFNEAATNGTNYLAVKAGASMASNITMIMPTSAATGALVCTNSSGTETCAFTAIGDITTGAFAVPHVDGKTPITIADSGNGSAAASTLTTPATSYYEYTCSDTDGCDLTLGETSVTAGQRLTIVNVSANALNIADTSGISETAGTMALGQYDSISFIYATDRWVETGRSNN